MKTIITYGTFDMFHVGHVRLLSHVRSLGDKLIVGCSTDEFNAVKGKQTVIPFKDRVEVLQSSRFVDEVFAESCWNQKRADIIRWRADIFAIGNDWTGKFDDLSDICTVMYLPRTEGISSTELRDVVRGIGEDTRQRLRLAIEHLNDLIKGLE